MRVMTAVALAAMLATPFVASSADAAQGRGGGGGGFHGGGGGGFHGGGGGFRGGMSGGGFRSGAGGGGFRGGAGGFRGGPGFGAGGGAFRGGGFRGGIGGYRGGAPGFRGGDGYRGGRWSGGYGYGDAFIGGLGAGLLFDTLPGWYEDPFWSAYGYEPFDFGYAPPAVIAPAAPAPYAPAAGPGQTWYYCADPQGYYPYVASCNTQWQVVPAAPAGPAG